MPLNVPDQIDGQAISMVVYPGGQGTAASAPLGGLQTVRWHVHAPQAIRVDTNGKKRYQKTDTTSVDWACSQFTIYKQTFADIMGLKSDPAVDYGNLRWQDFIFDFVQNFLRLSDTGAVVQGGGNILRYAAVTDYESALDGPFEIVMTNVTGLAFSQAPLAWV